jgi:hypothetical protein
MGREDNLVGKNKFNPENIFVVTCALSGGILIVIGATLVVICLWQYLSQ